MIGRPSRSAFYWAVAVVARRRLGVGVRFAVMPRICRDRILRNATTGRRSVVVRLGALPKLPPRIRRPKFTYRQSLYALGHIEREAFTFIDARASDDLFASTSVAQLAEALRINRSRAHRLILRLSDRGWVRPTDRFRTRWLPTLKAWIAEHIGDVERAVILAVEAVDTENQPMLHQSARLLADVVRMIPDRFKDDAVLALPRDFGLLTPPSAPSAQRAGQDSNLRQVQVDPPDPPMPTP